MSLLTQVNERTEGNFYFQQNGGANAITSLAGVGILGTITNSTSSVNHVYPYTFQNGIYYVQVQIEIDVNATTAGDILVCSTAQNGVLNPNELVATFSASGYSAGQAGRLMLEGYVKCIPGSGLNVVVGTYGVGVSSSYQIQNPTNSFVYIQKVD